MKISRGARDVNEAWYAMESGVNGQLHGLAFVWRHDIERELGLAIQIYLKNAG